MKRTIYRKCKCGETAHDLARPNVYACRNCRAERTVENAATVSVPDLLAALTSAGVNVRAMYEGFYRVEGTGLSALLTISARGEFYRVSLLNGKRWRTLGKWTRPARVVAEVAPWVERGTEEKGRTARKYGVCPSPAAVAQAFTDAIAAAHASIPVCP